MFKTLLQNTFILVQKLKSGTRTTTVPEDVSCQAWENLVEKMGRREIAEAAAKVEPRGVPERLNSTAATPNKANTNHLSQTTCILRDRPVATSNSWIPINLLPKVSRVIALTE